MPSSFFDERFDSKRQIGYISLTIGEGLSRADKCKPSATLHDSKSCFPNRPRTRKMFSAPLRVLRGHKGVLRVTSRIN